MLAVSRKVTRKSLCPKCMLEATASSCTSCAFRKYLPLLIGFSSHKTTSMF